MAPAPKRVGPCGRASGRAQLLVEATVPGVPQDARARGPDHLDGARFIVRGCRGDRRATCADHRFHASHHAGSHRTVEEGQRGEQLAASGSASRRAPDRMRAARARCSLEPWSDRDSPAASSGAPLASPRSAVGPCGTRTCPDGRRSAARFSARSRSAIRSLNSSVREHDLESPAAEVIGDLAQGLGDEPPEHDRVGLHCFRPARVLAMATTLVDTASSVRVPLARCSPVSRGRSNVSK